MMTRRQRALWNYTPVLHSMPAPGIESILSEPLVCVTFSKALVPYLLGLLEIYRYYDKFSGTNDEILTGLGVIQDLVAAIAEGNCIMLDVRQNTETPCILEKSTDGETWTPWANLALCSSPLRTTRYNPTTDSMEVSTDGGVTWTPAPEIDPRIINTFPPASSKCDAAASMVRYIRDFIDLLVNIVNAGTALTAAITLIAGFLALIGATFAALVLLMIDLFTFVTSTGATVVSAAFTSEVYDQLLCIFFCHVDDDGRLDDTSFSAVKSDINSQIGGVAAASLTVMFALTGFAGLNNAGASGLDTDDCSGCACNCETFNVYGSTRLNATMTVSSGTTYNVTATGTWTYENGVTAPFNANGDGGSIPSSDAELNGTHYGCLLYRIGTGGTWHEGGTMFSFTADADGTVYMGMNESTPVNPAAYSDNDGVLVVEICPA